MKIKSVMRKTFVSILLLLCLAFVADAQVTAIRAGRVVDPETGTVLTNQVILVEGQNIKEIGANVQIPANANVIDLSRQVVLPGLFDAHTHLCMNMQHKRDGGSYYVTTLLDSTAKRAIQGVANARSMLEYGFTTVRDIGNAGNYADTELRRAIADRHQRRPHHRALRRAIFYAARPEGFGRAGIFLRRHARRDAKGDSGKHPLRRASHQNRG
jgi:cytosine/adenosine deaminase-related metal-dependent hydrolase